MTRAEKRAVALRMHGDGASRREIADALGYRHPEAITALLRDPDEQRAVWSKDNARRSAAKRAWEREHDRGQCPCGARTSVGARRSGYMLCASCRRDVLMVGRAMREERIAEMWAQGLTLRAIADALGSTVSSIGRSMSAMRERGWDLPYRHNWSEESLESVRNASRARRAA